MFYFLFSLIQKNSLSTLVEEMRGCGDGVRLVQLAERPGASQEARKSTLGAARQRPRGIQRCDSDLTRMREGGRRKFAD